MACVNILHSLIHQKFEVRDTIQCLTHNYILQQLNKVNTPEFVTTKSHFKNGIRCLYVYIWKAHWKICLAFAMEQNFSMNLRKVEEENCPLHIFINCLIVRAVILLYSYLVMKIVKRMFTSFIISLTISYRNREYNFDNTIFFLQNIKEGYGILKVITFF